MMQVILVLWVTSRKVHGVHKFWKEAYPAGHVIGRDQADGLMRDMGIDGVSRRGKMVFTTVVDLTPRAHRTSSTASSPADHPNRLWVTDLVRHEAPLNLAVMKGHRHMLVAAGVLKLRAA